MEAHQKVSMNQFVVNKENWPLIADESLKSRMKVHPAAKEPKHDDVMPNPKHSTSARPLPERFEKLPISVEFILNSSQKLHPNTHPRTSIMPPPALNSEPADPEEREQRDLPPKSYADAADPSVDVSNGRSSHNGTSAPSKRPDNERQESSHEYSAEGTDDTPKSPTRQKHRKITSKSADGSDYKEFYRNGLSTSSSSSDFNDEEHDIMLLNGQRSNGRLATVKQDIQRDHRVDRPVTKTDETLQAGKKAGQRWHNSPIRFAPLNVPLQRRLQTMMVLFHTLSIALGAASFFFLCAIPLFWPLLIPYMIYTMTSKASTDGKLKFRSDFIRKLPIWSLFASYFPARLYRTEELIPTRKYIFGYHPHGIISMGAFAAFATEALGFSQLFPGIKNSLLTLDSNFRIPVYREYALAMGMNSVSRESCENILTRGGQNNEGMGRAITIVVGGARESLDALPRSLRLVLRRRKGFVKLAIHTGADLVPVLGFGENDIYDQFEAKEHPNIHKFQLLIKKILGFTVPLFHARGVFNYDVGLMPYRRPMNIVVGRPIRVIQSSSPTQAEVDELHEQYITELERLWDTWKDEFSPNRQEELQILE